MKPSKILGYTVLLCTHITHFIFQLLLSLLTSIPDRNAVHMLWGFSKVKRQ